MESNLEEQSKKNKMSADTQENRLLDVFVKVMISGLIYVAFTLSLVSMLQLELVSLYTLIPGIVIMIILFSIKMKRFPIDLALFILFMLGLPVIQYDYLIDGMLLIVNQLAETIGIHTGIILTQYEINLESTLYGYAINYFWSYFSIFISFICYYSIQHRRSGILWVLLTSLCIFQFMTDIVPNIYINLLLAFSILMLLNYTFIHRSNKPTHDGNGRNKVVLSTSGIFVLLFSIVLIATNYLFPSTNYTKPAPVKKVEQVIVNQVDDFRFEKEKTNSFTQGDFTTLGELELLEEEALEVIMEEPTSLYLRGFVGSEYTRERWEPLDEESQYQSYGLFYWLNEHGFHPLNQLSLASTLNDENENDVTGITVNNLQANSKYIYTPYELVLHDSIFEQTNVVDGSMIQSNSFFGSRLYDFDIKQDLVTEYPSLANQVYEMKSDQENEEYFNHENHYNSFVYENYTRLPDNIEILLDNHLEIEIEGDGQHISYEEAIEFVQTYLMENIEYSIHASPLEDNRDFLTELLEHTRSGYATHFATAGTAIFRYLGIPARYVEGYLITPQDIEEVDEFERVTIEGTNAHAWTEIYLDQVGWIPIEVTPPYYDVMEATDLRDYPEGDFAENQANNQSAITSGGSSLPTEQVVEEQELPNAEHDEPPERRDLLENIIIMILIFIGLLMMGYLIYIAVKRKQLNDRKQLFYNDNYSVAISALYEYSMSLLYYNGLKERGGSALQYVGELEEAYSEEYAASYRKIIQINQEARFSNNQIPEESYQKVLRFKDETLQRVIESKSIFKRLKMKFIDFIY